MESSDPIARIDEQELDMLDFLVGDGRLYEVQHSSGSQARHQTQIDEENKKHFFHTKGSEIEAEWEELWTTRSHIYRGTDTSPGNDEYYTLYEDIDVPAASPWSPRFWKVGDLFERNPYVIFYRKEDCSVIASGYQRSWLRLDGFYEAYTFESGITLNDVIVLAWLLHPDGEPVEIYFYAQDYGLVGWGSSDRGYSYISEIHDPGQRPDNMREEILCLQEDLEPSFVAGTELNPGPLPEPYASRVK